MREWFLADLWIQSGPSRDPVGTQSGTNFSIFGHRFWPVGIQSGSSRDPVGKQPKPPKNAQKHCKNAIFFAKMLLVPDWVPTFFRLDPDWIPGQKRCPKMLKLVPDWVPTGSRLGPDWVPTGSRLDPDWFSSKKHLFP